MRDGVTLLHHPRVTPASAQVPVEVVIVDYCRLPEMERMTDTVVSPAAV